MAISKHELLAHATDALGINWLLRFVAHRPLLLVVNYHRLGSTGGNLFDDGVFSATATDFETQVRFLQDNFRLLTLDALLELAANNFGFSEPSALITFDDGYRDNFTIALPILTKCGATATFFVATSYLDHPRLPWWDRIAFIIKQAPRKEILLDLETPLCLDLETTPRARAINQVLRYYKTIRQSDPEIFFAHLEDRAGVRADTEALSGDLFMSWDQLTQLSATGMGIGSHTHTHQILAHLSESDEQQELAISKGLLEARLSRPVTTLSYPVGQRNVSFTERTKHAAVRAGYRLAFSFEGGLNRPKATDPFEIKRMGVDANESLPLFRTRMVFHTALGREF